MSKETILLVNRSDIVPLLEECKILMSIGLCICFQLVIGRMIGRTKTDYFLLNEKKAMVWSFIIDQNDSFKKKVAMVSLCWCSSNSSKTLIIKWMQKDNDVMKR